MIFLRDVSSIFQPAKSSISGSSVVAEEEYTFDDFDFDLDLLFNMYSS